MTATIYVILGSHACRAGTLMLEHKRVPFRTVRLPTVWHAFGTRLLGFPGRTVPALRIDGRRVQTNREIARFLDELQPEPRLLPADPAVRRVVEEAECFGDEVLQMTARRLTFATALPGHEFLLGHGGDGRLGPLLWTKPLRRRIGMRLVGRLFFKVNERSERGLLSRLPAELDRVDALVEAGVLNGESLNGADFAIAPSLALLSYRGDLRADLESRPSWALVERVLPAPSSHGS